MDFFEGLTHVPVGYAHPGPLLDQESLYWSMNMNAYKFGFPGPASTSYCGPYEVNDHLPRVDVSRMVWEYPLVMNTEELPATNSQLGEEEASGVGTTEEYIPDQQNTDNSSSVVWQEGIDPDNMTYESRVLILDSQEFVGVLLDLGSEYGNLGREVWSRGRSVRVLCYSKRSIVDDVFSRSHEYHSTKDSVTVTSSLRRGGGNRQDGLSTMAVYVESKTIICSQCHITPMRSHMVRSRKSRVK
ncbi:hypothetical protein UlMin_000378 [Ulmus minor]